MDSSLLSHTISSKANSQWLTANRFSTLSLQEMSPNGRVWRWDTRKAFIEKIICKIAIRGINRISNGKV